MGRFKATKTDREIEGARRATREQVAGVRRLVREQVAAVERIEPEAIKPVLEVLTEARRELREDLRRWMATIDNPTDTFTAHRMRVMLRSLEGTCKALGVKLDEFVDGRAVHATRAERALLDGLRKGTRETGALSVKALETEIGRLGHLFEQSLVGPQIDQAIVLARGDRLLFKSGRIPSSAARYGGNIADDLRFQISVGVARGETFEQLTQRLRRIGGPTGPVAVRGIMGHPGAIIEDIPEGLFVRYRHFAERVVRTEMMNAYNIQHREGIRLLNKERSPGTPEYMRRWDATADARVCSICRRLHDTLAPIGGDFPGGYDHPPAHPNCRCVELAWRPDWGGTGASEASEAKSESATEHAAAVPPEEKKKNQKRIDAARKAGEASQERRREIYSAVRTNLPEDLHVAWDKEGHKFMRQEAGRIKGERDNINAASKMSEAFAEQYGAGHETTRGYEGDRFHKRAEIEAKHAETWADEQERKYYEAAQAAALHAGEIDENGELTELGRAKQAAAYDEWSPPKASDDDPPF